MRCISTINQALAEVETIRGHYREHLVGLYLTSKLCLVHKQVISIGNFNQNLVAPREIFAPALHHPSQALILVHNHPSGIAKPSSQDISVTKNIAQAGKILAVQLIDHLIVTRETYYSFREEGLLDST